MQRVDNIYCLLYGGNPQRFSFEVEQLGFPVSRQQRCVNEYPQLRKAWDQLLAPHVARAGAR